MTIGTLANRVTEYIVRSGRIPQALGLADTYTPSNHGADTFGTEARLRALLVAKGTDTAQEPWKKNLVNYLNTAHAAGFQGPSASAGFLSLDQEEGGQLAERQRLHQAPGMFNVVVHGRRPYNVDDMTPSQDRNQIPFWDGGGERDANFLTSQQLTERIRMSLTLQNVPADVPVFLDACNAGTDLNGTVPARDIARGLNRPVVAAVNSRVFQSTRGPVLRKQGAYWATFYPNGKEEVLWKPATPTGWSHAQR